MNWRMRVGANLAALDLEGAGERFVDLVCALR